MIVLYSIVQAISGMAISLGVGASTFALIFYFMALRGPEHAETGRAYQKAVYIVLRIAMVLILLTEIARGINIFYVEQVTVKEVLGANVLLFIWTLVLVLFLNAILMTLHRMPMKLGPAIQATSWYTLGVMAALPPAIVTFTYLPLMLTYLGCIIGCAVIIELISQKIRARIPSADGETVHLAVTEVE